MLELKRILLPVDFSAGSFAAAERAVGLATAFGARIDAVHVWQPPYLVALEMVIVPSEEKAETVKGYAIARAQEALEAFLDRVRALGDVPVEGRVVVGDARAVILQQAREGAYDMIVMGTHGRTGAAHLLVGSVTESVVRAARCPVLTVRQAAGATKE